MTATTQLTGNELQRAIDAYELGRVTSFTLAGGGIENSNYLIQVTTPAGPTIGCVLTVLETPSNSSDDAYVALLDRCVEHGLPVPRVYRTYLDQTGIQIKGKRALVSQQLPGAHVANATAAQLQAVGRFFARFHSATQDLAANAKAYPRTASWLRGALNQLAGDGDLADLSPILRSALDAGVAMVEGMLSRTDTAALPSGYIHGDGFRDNLLFDAQGLTGVIDFHHACRGTWMYDLAVVANDWCAEGSGELNLNKVQALLHGYHSQRALEPSELWWFGAYAQYAATAFALSRLLARADAKHNAAVRWKDPVEMLVRLERLQARSPLLDNRLLDTA